LLPPSVLGIVLPKINAVAGLYRRIKEAMLFALEVRPDLTSSGNMPREDSSRNSISAEDFSAFQAKGRWP